MNVLALNSGSNSLKFELFRVAPDHEMDRAETVVQGAYDNIGKSGGTFSLSKEGREIAHEDCEIRNYGHAAELLFDRLEGGAREFGVSKARELDWVEHRVVHGGDLFDRPARIDDEVIERIRKLEELAPLHNKSSLAVIEKMRTKLGPNVPMAAVLDTVFHRGIPEHAALYGLPSELSRRYKIRRYGFHGLSHRYMMLRFAQIARRPASQLKFVTAHLEGGSSVAAIEHGRSVDTSMGFTPLEGLMMGTRSGDLDPAIVCFLMQRENLDAAAAEEFLNKKCGLLGVSGVSADTRDLMKNIDDPHVALALDMFSYRVRKYIGAYLAVLDGADAVVLGGGIAENTPEVRRRILRNLSSFGIALDSATNEELIDREGHITAPHSTLAVWVIPTRENLMVAQEAASVCQE
jgi:acetate kinase